MAKVWDDGLPSHEEVAKYWCGRPIPGSDRVPLVALDEPECFACGWCRLWQVRSHKAQKDIWKGLQRAHVLARSLGGPDTVENLALLCKSCHDASPDTADPAIFWRWVADHPRNGSIDYLRLRDFNDLRVTDYRGPFANYLRSLGSLTDDELTVLANLCEADSSGMLQQLREANNRLGGVTRHWGIGLSDGTIAALLREIVHPGPTRTSSKPTRIDMPDSGA